MAKSTLLFVHGTGARSVRFSETLAQIRSKALDFNLPCEVEPCLWGEVLGIDFEGLSLPDPPVRSADEEAQALRWEYLQVDPVFDLRLWCTPAAEPPRKVLGKTPAALAVWDQTVSKYTLDYAKRADLITLLQHNRVWKQLGEGLAGVAFLVAG